jgi:hypothetical protein
VSRHTVEAVGYLDTGYCTYTEYVSLKLPHNAYIDSKNLVPRSPKCVAGTCQTCMCCWYLKHTPYM